MLSSAVLADEGVSSALLDILARYAFATSYRHPPCPGLLALKLRGLIFIWGLRTVRLMQQEDDVLEASYFWREKMLGREVEVSFYRAEVYYHLSD